MGSVILVHGLRTSATMWRSQIAALESAGHHALAIDLPGHGRRMSERFTLERAVDAIAQAVDAAAERPVLCGLSLGGYTALHYAGLADRPVRAIVAASCGTQPRAAVLAAWRAAARVIHTFPDRGLALHNGAVRLAVRDPALARDAVAGGVALEVMDDALREVRALRPLESIARIRQPIWFVNGALDHFRLEERRYLRAASDGHLVHIPGATHLVSLTRPAEFSRVLAEVLDSAPA